MQDRPLTQKQKDMAHYIVYHPFAKDPECLAAVPVDPKTLWRWKKSPKFQDYMHELCQERFKSAEKIAMEKCIELARQGNTKMIQYLLDGAGYKAEDKVSVTSGDINITISDD